MKEILQPDRIAGESKIVSLRVPAGMHAQLHKVAEHAKSKGMRLYWQDLIREHLAEYIKLADSELQKYGNNKSKEYSQVEKPVSS
jgi:hypothetical protein